jgi:hypothetical protein
MATLVYVKALRPATTDDRSPEGKIVKDPSEEDYHHEALDERRSRELVKRVRKLRWIGSEDEARRLEEELRATGASGCVLAGFLETD